MMMAAPMQTSIDGISRHSGEVYSNGAGAEMPARDQSG